jgi:hypothetical protein
MQSRVTPEEQHPKFRATDHQIPQQVVANLGSYGCKEGGTLHGSSDQALNNRPVSSGCPV